MGRPKKISGEKRDKRLSVYVTRGEMNIVAARAAVERRPVSDFMLERLLRPDTPTAPAADAKPAAPAPVFFREKEAAGPDATTVALQNLVSAISGKETAPEALLKVHEDIDTISKILLAMLDKEREIAESQIAIIKLIAGRNGADKGK